MCGPDRRDDAAAARGRAAAMVAQATELLMARFGCGPEMAFELLRGASLDANVKVHVVAERLIEQRWDNDQENPG